MHKTRRSTIVRDNVCPLLGSDVSNGVQARGPSFKGTNKQWAIACLVRWAASTKLVLRQENSPESLGRMCGFDVFLHHPGCCVSRSEVASPDSAAPRKVICGTVRRRRRTRARVHGVVRCGAHRPVLCSG